MHDLLIASVYVYINMNEDDKSMLPPVGPEAEESLLRLLDEMYYIIVLCKRSDTQNS